MKTHYTAKELAGLPGMPGTERGVQLKADRKNWSSRQRTGKGGGREYPLSALPQETQDALTRSILRLPETVLSASVPAVIPDSAITPTHHLKKWQRDAMDARVSIMRLIERAAAGVGVNKAINTIVNDATEHPELAVYSDANIRKGGGRTLSYGGIIKWWVAWKKSGGDPLSVCPKDNAKHLEPEWAEELLKCWRKPQKPCLTEVLEELSAIIPAGMKAPSYSKARRYLTETIGTIEAAKGRMTGNALKTVKPFRRRDTGGMLPGDAYTADGHCFDAEVMHPYHGRPFRPEITPVLDVFSRKCVGWSCDIAESGLAVLDALRMACENWGIPAIFYTDNGSGYKNQMMTAAGTGLLHRLGITPEYSRPRNPQAHGLSERAHQTILIKAARGLCTYIGSTMDGDTAQLVYKKTRKQLAEGEISLLIEWDDFVQYINNAVEKYNNTPHTGLPALRDPISRKRVHQAPNQAWVAGYEKMMREQPKDNWLVPAKDLPDLYHPAVERTVIKGEIRLGTLSNGMPKRYYSPQLAEWNGERVQVAFSPSDASRVWVRDMEHQRLLAVAELAGNSDAYFADSVVDIARVNRGKSRLKRLENHAEEIRLEMYGIPPVPVENPDRATLELVRKEIEAAELIQASVFILPQSPRDKETLWQVLDERVNGGEILEGMEKSFHTGWQGDEYHQACLFVKAELEAK